MTLSLACLSPAEARPGASPVQALPAQPSPWSALRRTWVHDAHLGFWLAEATQCMFLLCSEEAHPQLSGQLHPHPDAGELSKNLNTFLAGHRQAEVS